MAAGSWARLAAERRIARTQLFVFVASWLWNNLASLVDATPFCRSHPRLVPMNTQSGILCDPASLVLYGRWQASSRPHARSRKGEFAANIERTDFFIESNLMYNPPMRGIPWSTIALGSLLLISARSTGGQEVKSPQPEKSKPPVKTEQRGRIIGIGGVFFKSANRDQMREWYSKHLGLADTGQGAMLPWREHDDPQKEHVTVWTVFPASNKYFDPSPAPFMINYIVDDMDALLDRLKQEGVKIDAKRMDESYGRFAWIYDMDGNKIELWQPLPAKP
jgi:catechol 2,3-dioxygenase-like lactoylglutathione lyase family enzyme